MAGSYIIKAATFAGIAVGGDLTSRVVMVSGTQGHPGYLGQLVNPSTDGPRLHDPRHIVKHVEQVPGYADQIPFRRTTQQPEPLLPVVKVGCDE